MGGLPESVCEVVQIGHRARFLLNGVGGQDVLGPYVDEHERESDGQDGSDRSEDRARNVVVRDQCAAFYQRASQMEADHGQCGRCDDDYGNNNPDRYIV